MTIASGVSTAFASDSPTVQQQLTELQQAVSAQKAQLEAQQRVLEQQAALIEQLQKQSQASETASASVAQLEQTLNEAKLREQDGPKVSMNLGRPTITSADDRTAASLRAVVQFDMAEHQDGTTGPLTTDFRRGSTGGTNNRESNAIERREPSALPNPSFGGYYAQTSWVLTGESHRYNVSNGSFQSPRPYVPFSLAEGGWGAWELALRYSHSDLDFREGLAGTAATPDSIRGGTQNIWTFGINWYANSNFRLMLDYLRISADRLNPAGPGNPTPFGPAPGTPPPGVQVGQDLDVVALRSQFSF